MSTPDEDDAWRTIVENYGDRPLLPEPVVEPEPAPVFADSHPDELNENPQAHFVPPPPPPVQLPEPPRLLSWLGVLGVPVLVLIAISFQITLPQWFSLALLAWFVSGFVYLVVRMRGSDDRDGWDDGAVL